MAKVRNLKIVKSSTDGEVIVSWNAPVISKSCKSKIDHYKYVINYTKTSAKGDIYTVNAESSTTDYKTITYSYPDDAIKLIVKVKPVPKEYKYTYYDDSGNEKEGTKTDWSGAWSSDSIKVSKKGTPSKLDAPNTEVSTSDKNTVTCSYSNIEDSTIDHVMFYLHKYGGTKTISSYVDKKKAEVTRGACSIQFKLTSGIAYVVRAVSMNGSVEGDTSDFTDVIHGIPSTPSIKMLLVTPSGTTDKNVTVTVNPSKSDTDVTYTVEYATEKRFFDTSSAVKSKQFDAKSESTIIDDIEEGYEYYFRVKASNDTGDSGWSSIKSIVIGTTPSAPTTWTDKNIYDRSLAYRITFYWLFNAKDNSACYKSKIKLTNPDYTYETKEYEFEIDHTNSVTKYYQYTRLTETKASSVVTCDKPANYTKAIGKFAEKCRLYHGRMKDGCSVWNAYYYKKYRYYYANWKSMYVYDIYKGEMYKLTSDEAKNYIAENYDGEILDHPDECPDFWVGAFYIKKNGGSEMSTSNDYSEPLDVNIEQLHRYYTGGLGGAAKFLESLLTNDSNIRWKIATAGISGDYSDYSVERIVSIIKTPEISMDVSPIEEIDEDNYVTGFPIKITLDPDDSDTNPLVYFDIRIVANSSYSLQNYTGEDTIISESESVYSTILSKSEDDEYEVTITPSDTYLVTGQEYSLIVTGVYGKSESVTTSIDFTVNISFDGTYGVGSEYQISGNDYYIRFRPYVEDFISITSKPDDWNKDEGYKSYYIYDGTTYEQNTSKTWDPSKSYYSYDEVSSPGNKTLLVYRQAFDGEYVLIQSGITPTENGGFVTWIVDPHPEIHATSNVSSLQEYSFKSDTYRIVCIDNDTGQYIYDDIDIDVSEFDCDSVLIQWDEQWEDTNLDGSIDYYSGNILELPFNIDISESNTIDVENVEYIGRKHPVSYYGTQVGQAMSIKCDIDAADTDTIDLLRRLSVYMGNVYIRTPNGIGYWATVSVSWDTNHCEVLIPVTISVTRVEGTENS